MRIARFLFTTIPCIVIVVLLAIFAVQNIRPASYVFINATIPGNVWWTVAGSALLGFLFALFMLLPGRFAAGWRGRGARRESDRRAQELEVLRAQNAQLQAAHDRLQREHQGVLAERDWLRSQTPPAPPAGGTQITTTLPPEEGVDSSTGTTYSTPMR